MALISSSTNSTAVAVIEPRTVIAPCQRVTGPSVTGAVWPGAAHTSPAGLGAVGAAQPDRASSNCLSLRIGLGTWGLPSNRRDRAPLETNLPLGAVNREVSGWWA